MSRTRNSHDLMDTKESWLFHLGGNVAFTIIMLNWSWFSTDNEHVLFCWLMRPTDIDIFNWDLFYLSLFCIWMAPTENLKIKAAKAYQTTESDGNINLCNQKCSLNKDWEQLMHSGFWSTLNLKSAFSQISSRTSESTQLLYTTTSSFAKQPTVHKRLAISENFQNSPTIQKCTVLSEVIHVCASFTSFLSSWLAMKVHTIKELCGPTTLL